MSIVMVTGGLIEGVQKENCVAFLGIPYAAPPKGELRQKLPGAVLPWEGVKQCDHFSGAVCGELNKSGCPQTGRSGECTQTCNGDCLYLNVWTPDLYAEKLPVFVWIHSGGQCSPFSGGVGNPKAFAKGGIVYVSFDYRLCELEQSACPQQPRFGSCGQFDQLAVLQWVKENIAAFGGDPGNITLGTCLVPQHRKKTILLSEMAVGMYQKAIILSDQSGHPGLQKLESIGENLGFPGATCAMKKSADIPVLSICVEADRTCPLSQRQKLNPTVGHTWYRFIQESERAADPSPNRTKGM